MRKTFGSRSHWVTVFLVLNVILSIFLNMNLQTFPFHSCKIVYIFLKFFAFASLISCMNSSAGRVAPGFGIGALEELDVEDEDVYAPG